MITKDYKSMVFEKSVSEAKCDNLVNSKNSEMSSFENHVFNIKFYFRLIS